MVSESGRAKAQQAVHRLRLTGEACAHLSGHAISTLVNRRRKPGSRLAGRRGHRDLKIHAAIERVVAGLTSSGVVSAASNRRAFRITQEPLDMFRNYAAIYAREQAYCHFSPALIANLEKYWNAASRKP